MDDGRAPMPYPDPTPYSNPPRTEEISVAGKSGIVGGLIGGVCLGVLAVGVTSGLPTFLIILAGIGAGLGMFSAVRAAAESRSWDPLVVHFGQSHWALGSASNVTIERRCRKVIPDVAQQRLNVKLRCDEWVRYTVGTETEVEHETVFEQFIDVDGSIQANTFRGTFDVEIPVDRGGPTLDLRNNKVKWTLAVELEPISTFSKEQDIEFDVSTVLDRRRQRFVDAPPPPRPQDA